jgi:small subunit ribosomal protein S16
VAVKLRLMRMGKKKQPTYRVVAADSRSPRDGRIIEVLGFYNPRSEPSVIDIDNEKALGWLRNGAQPTERVQKLLTVSGAWSEFTGQAPPTPYIAESSAAPSAPAPYVAGSSTDDDVVAESPATPDVVAETDTEDVADVPSDSGEEE